MKIKLTMSVERLPGTLAIPIERRNRLMARVCAEFIGGNAYDLTVLADQQDQFEPSHLAAMFRHMAKLSDVDCGGGAEPGEMKKVPVGEYQWWRGGGRIFAGNWKPACS